MESIMAVKNIPSMLDELRAFRYANTEHDELIHYDKPAPPTNDQIVLLFNRYCIPANYLAKARHTKDGKY